MNYKKFAEIVPDDFKDLREAHAAKIEELKKVESEIDAIRSEELQKLKGQWVAAPCPSSNSMTTVVRVTDVTTPFKSKTDGVMSMKASICLRLDFGKTNVYVYSQSRKFELKYGVYRILSTLRLMEIVEEYKSENPRLEIEFEKALAQF